MGHDLVQPGTWVRNGSTPPLNLFGRDRQDRTARLSGLALRAGVLALSCMYFANGINAREVSLLESQDLGIACDLFDNYALSPEHSPLHFVLVNFWQRLNGSSVAFLRAPSVIFCSVAVLLVFSLGEAVAGTLAGIAGAMFMTFNPEVVDAARSMRLYSLLVLASAMCIWFARAYLVQSKRKAYLFGFAASVLLAVYTHLFAWLLVGSLGLLFALDAYRHRRSREVRQLLKWAAVTLVLFTPKSSTALRSSHSCMSATLSIEACQAAR